MLELKELRFKGIGRFVEEQQIDFSSLADFIQVDGENLNTGGSSGSGKSTVFNALDYLLGINDLPSTVLQSRLTKEPISVIGKFDLDSKPLEVSRGKSGLRIDFDGKVIEGSSSKAEEELDKILGMSRELFRKTLHKRQKEGGFFMDFTPKKTHEFLADCLNLGEFKKKAEIVSNKLDELNKQKIKLESDLNAARTGLKATQDAILALGLAPIKDMHKEVILELKEKMERSALRLKDVQARCEQMAAALAKERPNPTFIQPDETVRSSLEGRRKEIEAEISATLQKERDRQSETKRQALEKSAERSKVIAQVDSGRRSKDEAAKIASEIKQIRASTCPTCEQHWTTESAKTTEQAKLADLARLKELIVLGAQAEQRKAVLDQEISALESMLTPIISPQLPILNEQLANITEQILAEKRKANELYEQQNAATKKLMDEFVAKQSALSNQCKIETDQARGQYDVDRRAFDIAVQKLKSYEEARVRYEESHSKLTNQSNSLEKEIVKCQNDLESTLKCIFLAEEAKKAIKMYISYSFDDALEIIGDSATKIIRCIPNMSNATIQFEGTKETKDGKVKEEVSAVIGMDGEVGIPIKSLSGGERSAVDLAVDLAVIDFIESKTGKGMNLFILDEPFTGLGTVEIEMALEVLKNSNTNKKLIIVDHNPEVKQMVQSRLVVVRDGTTSRVS